MLRLLAFPLERAEIGRAFLVAIWDWCKEGAYAAAPSVISGICRLIDKGGVPPDELLAYLRGEGEAGARLIATMGKAVGLPPGGFVEGSLFDHFLQHGGEVGASDSEDYEKRAVAVATHPLARTFLAHHPEGGARKYHLLEIGDGTLLVAVNPDNRVVTFFSCEGGLDDVLRLKRDIFKRPLFLKNNFFPD